MTPNDVKIVVDNIDDFVEVSDGVERLRKSVLTLAVSGRLVPQNKVDGSAEDVYVQLRTARSKAKSDDTVSRKKTKDLVPISDNEIPFDIPKLWKWVRLNEVSNINGGYAFKSQNFKDAGVRVIKISDFDENGFKDNKIVRHEYDPVLSQYEIGNKNILLCMTGGTVGKSYFVKNINERMVTNQRVATIKINRCLIPEYINHVILSPYIQKIINERKNSTNDNISMDDIKSFIVPLPPIAEQKRIVLKLEEVMKKLDELEAKKRERDEVRTRLTRSVMQSLGKGESKIAFEQLAALVITPADLKELERALLTLAVSGGLVPQDPNEGVVEDLLSIILKKRKSSLEGRNKKSKELTQIKEEDMPFKIPESWEWARLEDVCDIQTGRKDANQGDKDGRYNFYTCAKIPIKSNTYSFEGPSLILPGNGANVGYVFYVDENFEAYQRTYVLNKFEQVNLKYIYRVFEALWRERMGKQYGGAINFIKMGNLTNFLLPLPPLAEQERIVKKVDEIMLLINQLNALL